MRRLLAALLPAAALMLGCGGSGPAGGSGRDLNLTLDGRPAGRHAGIYLATARGYDRALGVTLRVGREPSDLRLLDVDELDPQKNVAVMAILPGDLYVAVDRVILDERRDDVRSALEAIQRGYEETVIDPESAASAMVDAEGLDRVALLEQIDAIAPRFKAGGRDFGVLDPKGLPKGAFDASLVRPSDRD